MYKVCMLHQARMQTFFKGGGLGRKILKEKCLLIHVSTRVHIKLDEHATPFQEDCLLIFAFFYYSFFFLKFERGGGGCNPRNPPLDPPMCFTNLLKMWAFTICILRKNLLTLPQLIRIIRRNLYPQLHASANNRDFHDQQFS